MSPFQQIAPDLVRDGLVKNKDWVPLACGRAERCFSEPSLQVAAVFLAALHPFAIDYIEQAPALVLGVVAGRSLNTRRDRLRIAQGFIVACAIKPRLKNLMMHYGLAPQLKVLRGAVLKPGHALFLKQLARVPAVLLGQSVPRTAAPQAAWLAAGTAWVSHMGQHFTKSDLQIGWVVQNLRATNDVAKLVDFAVALGPRFNTRWSQSAAIEARNEWFRAFVHREQRMATLWTIAIDSDQAINVAPFPETQTIGAHAFVALTSYRAIDQEGEAMCHCVGTYIRAAATRVSWLFSVRHKGRRVATLEAVLGQAQSDGTRAFVINQLKGRYNAVPHPDVQQAALDFVAGVNATIAEERRQRAEAARALELRPARRQLLCLLAARAR